jgi:transketolase
MRTAFFKALLSAAKVNPDLYLITGDLGYGVIEELVAECPNQVINAGVAEQGMTGMAAGLASAGAKVFTYSIANFSTLRCLEQIRNDVAYHNADVTVVAVGGGLAYGALGVSHHATEDLGIMRMIPNMAVAAPGDPLETERVLEELLSTGGPAYLRLGKAGEPQIHKECPPLPKGSSLVLHDGSEIALLVCGGILSVATEAAWTLAEGGHSVRLVSFPWIQPIDELEILQAATRCRLIVTIEEHSVVGGLGSCVSEIVSALPEHAPLLRLGIPRQFTSVVGSQDYLRDIYGLNVKRMVESILGALKGT